MKQRILVAIIGIPLLLLVLCWAPHWATAVLLAALGVIGAHELLAAVSGPEKTKQLWVLAGILAVLTVFATYAGREEYKGTVLAVVPWLLCAAADALKHPNWNMGSKITIDSATLMNKGLEIIEAMRLYGLPLSQVDAVIHRQSIVHSLVEYRDGAMIAQLGTPDMKLPIRYALTYPYRAATPDRTLDLLSCGPLTFSAPDEEAFPCLRIAKDCAAAGGTACAIMNGANEVAVAQFLRGEIGFNDIARRVERALSRVAVKYQPSLGDILEADRLGREAAR